ncbi:restriction endonuclease subunit S [Streptomonospora algeriensis]|uniref:Restriction endonuclease subunit S n=1 Tax=Streptomonospora algeriensis TaxID=995084 RepID=A0ABW3BB09_9ACTN
MKEIPLKYIARINSRTLPESTDPNFRFRYVDIGSVGGTGVLNLPSELTDFGSAPSRARRLADPGDTVVSTVRTYLRAVASVPESEEPLVFSTGFATLEAGHAVDQRYLSYFCKSDLFIDEVVSRSVGVSYPAVNATDIGSIEVPLPSREEQRRIADFLDFEISRIGRVEALRKDQKDLVEERELAHIFDVVRGSGIPGRSTRETIVWLGDVPAEWPVLPVSSQFSVQLGKMLNQERVGGHRLRPYLRVANIQWDEVDTSDLAYMNFPKEERLRYEVRPGDLLICEGGSYPGRAAIWDGSVEEIYYQKALHRARSRGRSLVRWLYYCLRIARAMGVFEADGNTSTITHLTGEQIGARRFPFPSPEIQEKMVRYLDEVASDGRMLQSAMDRQLALLTERRQALITAAVTGQIDVTTARGADVS